VQAAIAPHAAPLVQANIATATTPSSQAQPLRSVEIIRSSLPRDDSSDAEQDYGDNPPPQPNRELLINPKLAPQCRKALSKAKAGRVAATEANMEKSLQIAELDQAKEEAQQKTKEDEARKQFEASCFPWLSSWWKSLVSQ